MSPRVEVLGVAQDGGHPQAGCTRPCCARAWVAGGHRVASLGLRDGDRRWLVDATPDLPGQLRALGGPPLDGILLTHAHSGHYTGLLHLGPEAWAPRDVPLWVMPGMEAFLRANAPWSALLDGHLRVEPLADGVPVRLGAITVTPFLVPHRGPWSETVGFVIAGPSRSALFLPDVDRWEGWDRDPEALLAEVDVAWVDGTFFDGDELPHRALDQVPHPLVRTTMDRFAHLPAAARRKIRFVHLNHTNPLLDRRSAAFAEVHDRGFGVAQQGEVFAL